MSDLPSFPSSELLALAHAHGVVTAHTSFLGEWVEASAATLRDVLAAIGVAAHTPEAIKASLLEVEAAPLRALLPPSVVTQAGGKPLQLHVTDGHDVDVHVILESGERRSLPIPEQSSSAHSVDESIVWRVEVPMPEDLPTGWHRVHAQERRGTRPARSASAVLVISPDRLPAPAAQPEKRGRSWGLIAQLYSVRSAASWGLGDFNDLGDLAAIAGSRGADFVLINPVHASDVATPIEPSPYLPSSRRFLSPLYVRPEDIRETGYVLGLGRELIESCRASVAELGGELIDRDGSWTAKRVALRIIFSQARSPARQSELESYTARGGRLLADFALWCAIAEHYEGAERPPETNDCDSPLVSQLRKELSELVDFYVWLQWIAEQQLAQAQASALAAGMRIGIMHDLALGVHPLGADVWSSPELYVTGLSVGAPPDDYNAKGQNWSQPPWHPAALARTGYAPLRDLLRGLLLHSGAIRIDHVIGLFRLWCIPEGAEATTGAYLRYDFESMLGVLMLEASRADAVIVGEDLGTVEPWMRDELSSRGILGTSVLWFEQDGGVPRPPENYRQDALATVTTHDLPPTGGYLADAHVLLRDRLGLLARPLEAELADSASERDAVLDLLRTRGLIDEHTSEMGLVEALYKLILSSPSCLIGVSLVDAVGERRTQNLPGTHLEYPNWRVPLGGADGADVRIDDLLTHPRFLSLTAAVERVIRAG